MPSINQLRTGLSAAQLSSHSAPASKSNEPTEKTGTASSDQVSLSSQAKSAGQLHKQLASQPESFDSNKVGQIKEAIANGSYVIDAEKLASNMLKFENELSG